MKDLLKGINVRLDHPEILNFIKNNAKEPQYVLILGGGLLQIIDLTDRRTYCSMNGLTKLTSED